MARKSKQHRQPPAAQSVEEAPPLTLAARKQRAAATFRRKLSQVDRRLKKNIRQIEDASNLSILPFYSVRYLASVSVLVMLAFVATNGFGDFAIAVNANTGWFMIYAMLILAFYFFSSPFTSKTSEMRRHVSTYFVLSTSIGIWLAVALLYHLPTFESLGLKSNISLSLYLIVFFATAVFLLLLHVCYTAAALLARRHCRLAWNPVLKGHKLRGVFKHFVDDLWAIFTVSTLVAAACCVFYEHCGNVGAEAKVIADPSVLGSLKAGICEYWLAARLMENHSSYAWLVVYGEFEEDTDPLQQSKEAQTRFISPVYTLWLTFISLYMTNFLVEHTRSWERTTKIQRLAAGPKMSRSMRQLPRKPSFLPMVPWYSGTSHDLWSTLLDIIISMSIFAGRFEMRTLHAGTAYHHKLTDDYERTTAAAGKKTQQGGKKSHEKSTGARYGNSPDGFTYEHFAHDPIGPEGFWFDWMADTGDGGDSTYSVARCLAQPNLDVAVPENFRQIASGGQEFLSLPRPRLLVIGGDMAYPGPTRESYESRLFYPFEQAMAPPMWYDSQALAIKKPNLPTGFTLPDYMGPQAFVIPGNHDWYDGCGTFIRHICHKSWLGGWLMPQEKTYFALKLPSNWWMFCFDLGLTEDIDIIQFKYFSSIVDDKLGPEDRVICVQHVPTWLVDADCTEGSIAPKVVGLDSEAQEGANLTYLLRNFLMGKAVLRVAGDIHNYVRHTKAAIPTDVAAATAATEASSQLDATVSQSSTCFNFDTDGKGSWLDSSDSEEGDTLVQPTHAHVSNWEEERESRMERKVRPRPEYEPEHLIVSGGGGAFLHPTHPFAKPIKAYGVDYNSETAFPSPLMSRAIAFSNIFDFRRKNWRFDVVGGLLYFSLAFSLFPLCQTPVDLTPLMSAEHTWVSFLLAYFWAVIACVQYIFTDSYASLGMFLVLIPGAYLFSDSRGTTFKRVTVTTVHVTLHIWLALVVLVFIELVIVLCIDQNLIGKEGWHSLYEKFDKHQEQHFPDPSGLRARVEEYTFGLYPAVIKYFLTLFDVPNGLAMIRQQVCVDSIWSLSRLHIIYYYFGSLLYYWVLAAPICSTVIGVYLFVCVNYLDMHWDNGFSSLRNKNWKHFLRFHIKENGDLEMFAVGLDRVPHEWHRDPLWKPSKFFKWLPNRPRFTKLNATLQPDDSKQGYASSSSSEEEEDLSMIRRNSQYKDRVYRSRRKRTESMGTQELEKLKNEREVPSQWLPDKKRPLEPKIIDYLCLSDRKSVV